MVTLLGKLIIVYYKSRKNVKLFDLMMDFKTGKPMYRISQRHLKKLTLRSFILYYCYLRITGSIAFSIVILIVTWVTITTHLYYNYGNVIILWLWTIIIIMSFNQILIVVLVGALVFYVPIMILNYRFDELMDKLRVSIRWNNEQRLHQVLLRFLNDTFS